MWKRRIELLSNSIKMTGNWSRSVFAVHVFFRRYHRASFVCKMLMHFALQWHKIHNLNWRSLTSLRHQRMCSCFFALAKIEKNQINDFDDDSISVSANKWISFLAKRKIDFLFRFIEFVIGKSSNSSLTLNRRQMVTQSICDLYCLESRHYIVSKVNRRE